MDAYPAFSKTFVRVSWCILKLVSYRLDGELQIVWAVGPNQGQSAVQSPTSSRVGAGGPFQPTGPYAKHWTGVSLGNILNVMGCFVDQDD